MLNGLKARPLEGVEWKQSRAYELFLADQRELIERRQLSRKTVGHLIDTRMSDAALARQEANAALRRKEEKMDAQCRSTSRVTGGNATPLFSSAFRERKARERGLGRSSMLLARVHARLQALQREAQNRVRFARPFPCHGAVKARRRQRLVLWLALLAGASRAQHLADAITGTRTHRKIYRTVVRLQIYVRKWISRKRAAELSLPQRRWKVRLIALRLVGFMAVSIAKKREAGKRLFSTLLITKRSPARQLVRRYQRRVMNAQRMARTYRRITVERVVALLLMWESMERTLTIAADAKRVELSVAVVNGMAHGFRKLPSVQDIRAEVARQRAMEATLAPLRKPASMRRLGTGAASVARGRVPGQQLAPLATASDASEAGRPQLQPQVRGGSSLRGAPVVQNSTLSLAGILRQAVLAASTLRKDDPRSGGSGADITGDVLAVRRSDTGEPVVVGFTNRGTPMAVRLRLVRGYLRARRNAHYRSISTRAQAADVAAAREVTDQDMLFLMKVPRSVHGRVVRHLFTKQRKQGPSILAPMPLYIQARKDMRVLIEEGLRHAAVSARLEFQRLYASAQLSAPVPVMPSESTVRTLDPDVGIKHSASAEAPPSEHAAAARVATPPADESEAHNRARSQLRERRGWGTFHASWTMSQALRQRLGVVPDVPATELASAIDDDHSDFDVEAMRQRHKSSRLAPMSKGVLAVLDSLVAVCRATPKRMKKLRTLATVADAPNSAGPVLTSRRGGKDDSGGPDPKSATSDSAGSPGQRPEVSVAPAASFGGLLQRRALPPLAARHGRQAGHVPVTPSQSSAGGMSIVCTPEQPSAPWGLGAGDPESAGDPPAAAERLGAVGRLHAFGPSVGGRHPSPARSAQSLRFPRRAVGRSPYPSPMSARQPRGLPAVKAPVGPSTRRTRGLRRADLEALDSSRSPDGASSRSPLGFATSLSDSPSQRRQAFFDS